MSHIVTIRTQVRDPIAVRRACRRLALPEPTEGKHALFSGEVAGLAVKLREWKYPVICETHTGTLHYDNFNGRWGRQEELSQFLQRYAVEKATLEASRKGYTATEQPLPGGRIKLTLHQRGGG